MSTELMVRGETAVVPATATTTATVTNDFVSRQETARRACEAAGIVWPGTILPEGTALYSSGVDKLKSDRAAWRRLPIAGEVVGLVGTALAAEDRKDYGIKVSDLRLRPRDGRLVHADHINDQRTDFGLGYGPHTLRQLVTQVDPLDDAPRGFSSALLYLSDQERAEIVNKRIARTEPGTAVTLRTRVPHSGSRIARAALSGKYGSVTDVDIADALGQVMSGDTKGRLDYKPGDQRSRFEIIWPNEIGVETFVVGDVHYGMLSITNSETGEGSLRIAPAVVRAACANLTVSVGEGTEVVIRHIGDAGSLLSRLQKAIRSAFYDMEPLLAVITRSAQIEIGSAWTPARALGEIAKRYQLPAATAKSWTEQWTASHYPASIFGLSAAISEAAHKGETWADEHEMERVASVFQARAVEVVRKGTPHALAIEKALTIN
jgi:hypothetical protein